MIYSKICFPVGFMIFLEMCVTFLIESKSGLADRYLIVRPSKPTCVKDIFQGLWS